MTQNILRENMVRQAVAMATFKNLSITVDNVKTFLPGPDAIPTIKGVGGQLLSEMPSFELEETDIAPWQAEPMEIEDNRPADYFDPPSIAVTEVRPPEPPREQRYADTSAKLVELEQERAELRIELDLAHKAELVARNERDSVAHAFVRGFGPPQSQQQLIREYIASENAYRQAVKEGRIPGRRPNAVGGSMVDKFAAAQRGGNPAFAGRGYARGAKPASARVMPGVVPAKLPSQR